MTSTKRPPAPSGANGSSTSPKSSSASTMIECPICAEVSEQPYRNYGTKACYSCRAFFRRAHQKTRTPNFVCRKLKGSSNNNAANRGQRSAVGPCQVNVKTRRQCQKCRYDKCLRAGMRPELVMNEAQKRVRFRNVCFGGSNNGSRDDEEEILDQEGDLNGVIDHNVLIADVQQLVPIQLEQRDEQLSPFQQQQQQQRVRSESDGSDQDQVLADWEDVVGNGQHIPQLHNDDLNVDLGGFSITELSASCNGLNLTAQPIDDQDQGLGVVVQPEQPQILDIDAERQVNAPYANLYETPSNLCLNTTDNLIEASYATAAPNNTAPQEDESFGLLNFDSPTTQVASNDNNHEVNDILNEAAASACIFDDILPPDTQQTNHDQNEEELTDEENNGIVALNSQATDWMQTDFNIPVSLFLDPSWEDAALDHKAARFFTKSFSSVGGFGEDFLREYVMYSFDVPLSKSFVPRIIRRVGEEFRSALLAGGAFDEFDELGHGAQEMFLKSSNLFSAVALRVARVCNKPDALTQLTEIIGSSVSDPDYHQMHHQMNGGSPPPPPPTAADAAIWREKFSGVVPIDRLDKLRMLKINQQTGLFRGDEDSLSRYLELVENLRWAVQDEEVYRTLVVVALFSGDVSLHNANLSRLYQKYRERLFRQASLKCRPPCQKYRCCGYKTQKIPYWEDNSDDEEDNDQQEQEENSQDSDSGCSSSSSRSSRFAVVRTPVESMSSPARSEFSLSAPVPTWFSRSLLDAAELGDILKKVMMRKIVARTKERSNGRKNGNSRLIPAV